jgi:hypothetical protein
MCAHERGAPLAPLVRTVHYAASILTSPRKAGRYGRSSPALSGERGLAVPSQQVLVSCLCEHVVLFLEPRKLGFQVPNTLLEAAHLGHHAGIGTTDVAE